MAVQQLIGFETGAIGNEVASNSGGVVATTNVHSGTYALKCAATLTGLAFSRFDGLSATGGANTLALTTGFLSFYFFVVTAPAANDEIIARCFTSTNSTTLKLEVRLNASQQIVVYDSTAALVATGTTVIPLNTYTRIDIKASNGTAYEVRINGVTELSGTCTQGTNNVGNFTLGKEIDRNGNTVEFWFDDIWIDSTAYPTSDYKIALDIPTANGATQSWTGGTNTSDYTQVNIIPTQTTKFVADPNSASVPVIATFAMQTYAQMGIPAGSTILAIKSFTIARDNTTITNSFQMGISSNGVDSLTTALDTTNANTDRGKLHATDPNTSAAWAQSGLEAVLSKVVENTATVNTRVYSALIMVAYVPAVATTVSSSTLSLMGVG